MCPLIKQPPSVAPAASCRKDLLRFGLDDSSSVDCCQFAKNEMIPRNMVFLALYPCSCELLGTEFF